LLKQPQGNLKGNVMKIWIQVYLPHASYLRTVGALGAWDRLGVSEELDYSMPKFDKKLFNVPVYGNVGESTTEGYKWSVFIPTPDERTKLNLKTFPTILFYDVDQNKYVGKIEGTPQSRGVVETALKSIFATASQPAQSGAGTTTTTKAAGYGVFALLLLGFLKSKAV
jgi:hypothetical protein